MLYSHIPPTHSDTTLLASVFSTFFRHGQVLETFRGKGVYQPAVDAAIEKLGKGDWVSLIACSVWTFITLRAETMGPRQIHLFGEGKICQPETYAHTGGIAQLQRFKWGVCVVFSSPYILRSSHRFVDAYRSRILLETPCPPTIIPMWLTGALHLRLAFRLASRAVFVADNVMLLTRLAVRRAAPRRL